MSGRPAAGLRSLGRRAARTDGLDLAFVLLIAAGVRLAFALRPPPFLTPDSQGYYLPGWELANGLGFGPELRRTPLYSLFVALAVALAGEDLRALVAAQHGLGVVTAGLTWALGRLAFGRLAALAAGLGVALAGPLLIYEHYVLTESLFTVLLTLAVLLALRALRAPTRGRLLAAGVALATAALTRPVADVLIPLLPLALLLRDRRWRPAALSAGWFALGIAALMLPWMARNALVYGTFSAEGALGQALIGRTVRHDDADRFYTCPPPGDPASPKTGALRIICEEAAGEPSGGVVTQRVRDELGLSQAETSNLLRQVAFEAIRRQPGYYAVGSLRKAGEILVGKRETVIAPWRERTTRNWDNKWDPRLTPLVKNPPPTEGPDFEAADAVAGFFQPWRQRRELAVLLLVGLVAAALHRAWRPALVLPAAAGLIVLASAALDGNVWRYRYPVDPLLAATVGGGLEALALAARWARRRAGFQRSATAAPPTRDLTPVGRAPAPRPEARPTESRAAVERGA